MDRFGVAVATLLMLVVSAVASAQTISVAGHVANARGGVIANGDVTLRSLPPPGMPARMPNMPGMSDDERTTQTKADGTFSFDQVPPDRYVLQVDFSGFERSSQEITVSNQPQTIAVILQPLEIPGAETAARPVGGTAAEVEALLDRIKLLEQRITDLESSAVLSEPETRVRRVEVYVDQNGNVGTVKATATMPMPGMPMLGTIDVRRTNVPGRYEANSDFSMAGTWRTTVDWNGPAGQGSVTVAESVQ